MTMKLIMENWREYKKELLNELGPEVIDPVLGAEIPIVKSAYHHLRKGDIDKFNKAMSAAKSLGVGQGTMAGAILIAVGMYGLSAAAAASAAASTGQTVSLRVLPILNKLWNIGWLKHANEMFAKMSLWILKKTGSIIAAEATFNGLLLAATGKIGYDVQAMFRNKPSATTTFLHWVKSLPEDQGGNKEFIRKITDRWSEMNPEDAAKELQELSRYLE